jgi:hypothetical protein
MNLQDVQTVFSRPRATSAPKGNGDFWLHVIIAAAIGYVGYRIYQEIKKNDYEYNNLKKS